MSRQTQHEMPLWSFEFKTDSLLGMLSRQDLERLLIKRAWEDKSFKDDLSNNPKATIESEFEMQFPDSLEIEVLEESKDLFYMILPHNPYSGTPEPELKQALGIDLEDVAQLTIGSMRRSVAGDGFKSELLVARAWRDAAFKERILAEPEATLAAEFGVDVRSDAAIRVLEESPAKVYIVIPFFPDYELMDAESDLLAVNLPIAIGSDSSIPTDSFSLNCTQSFTCEIP